MAPNTQRQGLGRRPRATVDRGHSVKGGSIRASNQETWTHGPGEAYVVPNSPKLAYLSSGQLTAV